ncbi:energy transducer TonB [Phenylobacterium sp.]|uniref:energy transducer TonB n=1 Tax=Phenylobacterium sp. TaxID=1871053 RepID=UPI0025DA92B4|nr:energy transducer TonB [Phenylobacterium sp.]
MQKTLTVLAALAAMAPVAARADETPAPLAVRFTESPKAYQRLGPVGPYYPEIAVARRTTGSAVIDCDVGRLGALDRCAVVEENPKGVFFGAAALRMAERRWIGADLAAGAKEGAQARFLVPFEFATMKAR